MLKLVTDSRRELFKIDRSDLADAELLRLSLRELSGRVSKPKSAFSSTRVSKTAVDFRLDESLSCPLVARTCKIEYEALRWFFWKKSFKKW